MASNLIAGSNQFGFKITDNKGAESAEDFVIVTANPAVPVGSTYQVMVETDSTGASQERNGSPNAFLEQLHVRLANQPQYTGWLDFGLGGDTWTKGDPLIQMNSVAQRAEVLSGKKQHGHQVHSVSVRGHKRAAIWGECTSGIRCPKGTSRFLSEPR
ncbi:hypothetical protein [Hymenobacter sp. YC55]|uniref:hypothetical protein n=1 Tax=Hymenobacter sp. YC55 TaxID=3034019 RepID=UPI0023F82CED|nr:hypothetical protein [Hymenobacter sp. YC55]MDF7810651.1 hypothetical protein [Hymenobacter sp. YC55]